MNKFTKICAKSLPVVAALCLVASMAGAQTPAQDKSKVDADKAAVEAAQTAVKNTTTQMEADTAAKKTDAVQMDTVKLAADKQNLSAAEDKLKADMKLQSSDEARFNVPDTAPSAPVTTGTHIIPGTAVVAPAPVTTPVATPATNAVAGTPAAPVPATAATTH